MATSSSPPLHESEEFIGKELFILEDIAEVIDNLFFVIDQLGKLYQYCNCEVCLKGVFACNERINFAQKTIFTLLEDIKKKD